MSQFDFATIDPNAKSGAQLAVDLNNWRDALHSGHRGAERPPYAQAGMLWVRETSAEQWDLMLYDGDTDFVLRSVNPTTNQLIAIPQDAVAGLNQAFENILNGLNGKQDQDATLTALADLETGANKLPYFTGADAVGLTTLTAFARSLLGGADEAAAREILGAASDEEVELLKMQPMLHARDEKPSGTVGGTFTSGAWRTRDLNTVLTNTIAGASLSANQITLPAGAYEIVAYATAYQSGGTAIRHRARVYNITGGVALLSGVQSVVGGTSATVQSNSVVSGRFILTATSALELQHYGTTTKNTDGFGSALAMGEPEIYSDVIIRRIS